MTSKKAKGPATAPTVPSHGSITHPCMRKEEMNEATNSTAPAVGQELICDRVERLAFELSEALAEWNHGAFMGMVHPSGHAMGVYFRQVGASPEARLAYAAEAYQKCARDVDPSATEWWELRTPDESLAQRFVLIGAREQMA
ncbi:hypothetical protein [Agrobacterium pusense]|jgi:hypothetical protein|uniref:hypothetical protein n=1 Tax=Agrobacterium pusense TaxID=648995 RepID=UPI0037C10E17